MSSSDFTFTLTKCEDRRSLRCILDSLLFSTSEALLSVDQLEKSNIISIILQSFRKPARSTKQQTKEECIYEDISALQQLRKTFSSMGVEDYSKCTPPPLPPANIPLGGSSRHGNKGKKEGDYDVITVTVPQQTGNQYTIEDQDWYGSLEIHNTGGCNPKLDRGHTVDGAQTSPPRLTKDNDYSNCCPTSNTATEAENYNIYVDMSKGVRYTTR